MGLRSSKLKHPTTNPEVQVKDLLISSGLESGTVRTTPRSNSSVTSITNLSKLTIPSDYTLIKVASYYVNLQNMISIDNKIRDLLIYLNSNHRGHPIDILNIQGFNDTISLNIFVKTLSTYIKKHNLRFYIAPEFNIGNSDVTKFRVSSYTFHLSTEQNANKGSRIVQNVILSRYPIDSIIYSELDNVTDMDDIMGIQTIIGANIIINDRLIAMYNITLSKDIKNINNSYVRKTELEEILSVIEENIRTIRSLKQFNRKNVVHLLAGQFNINEIIDGQLNDEYVSLVENMNCIDIFRYLDRTELGYTTYLQERTGYIFLYIPHELYKSKSPDHHTLNGATNIGELLQTIFKIYHIHFISAYVVKSNEDAFYYPTECAFMIRTTK